MTATPHIAVGEEFRDDYRRELPRDVLYDLTRMSSWRSVRAIAGTLSFLFLVIVAALYCWQATELGVLRYLAIAVAVSLIGSRQHALFILAHDAAHYRLFEQRWLNDALGRALAGSVGLSMLTYRIAHRLHHNHLYQDNDPDVALHGGYPRGKAYLVKKLLKDLSGLSAYRTYAYFFGMPAKNAAAGLTPRPLQRDDTTPALRAAAHADRWFVAALQLCMLSASMLSGALLEYALLWLLPLACVVPVLLRLRALCEHGAVSDISSPLTAARSTRAPWLIEWLLFPHHVSYHLEHHLYASIPHYNLPACYRAMQRHGILDGAEVRAFGATMRRIFAERGTVRY